MTLVILAAGMGSRYGGLKQLDPMTKTGEFIIDFSIYDAIKAGFDRVVLIIKRENYAIFKQTIGDRISKFIKVEYAFQDMKNLPDGFDLPYGREKPWGTTHALLSCAGLLDYDNFAVINCDDYYGDQSFQIIASYLKNLDKNSTDWCMAGYILGNTLTDNGTVSRGLCVTNSDLKLIEFDERTKIYRRPDGNVVYIEKNEEKITDPNAYVSLNFWGFTPKIMDQLANSFESFMTKEGSELKSECFLPMTIKEIMAQGNCTVSVLPTSSPWYGVTYIEDKPAVVAAIDKMIKSGQYPAGGLWK